MSRISFKLEAVRRFCIQLALINCAIIILFFPGTSFAIEIEEVIWGFGNQLAKHECVPLSLHLSNHSPEPFDQVLQLNRLQYGGSRTGAPLYRKVYIAPYSSKWVQFYPYIIERGQNEWSLNWEPYYLNKRKIPDFRNHITFDQNEADSQTRVVLSSLDALSRGKSPFRQFPENLFPAYVTGTDSLDEVILNHLPQWDATRRKSFMDWLYRGGILHLLPDSTGNNLEFSAGMAELNIPLDHFRVGSGLVVRHQGDLSKFTINRLEAALNKAHREEVSAVEVDQAEVEKTNTNILSQNNYSQYIENINTRVLQQLSNMTRPEHNWVLIYLMTCLYIFIIFPGCLIFGKQQKGYRITLLFLLTTVALFSTIFWTIGKRGYGETTTSNSLAIVRPLKGDFYDVTCWNNSFVTDGAKYQFSANGEGVIFTTAQDREKIRGAISNGLKGSFQTDIPPFSDRRFMYRIKTPYPKVGFHVASYKLTEKSKLSSLTIGINSNLPENISNMQVLYNQNMYDLKLEQVQDSKVLVLDKRRTSISHWQSIFEEDLFFTNPYWNEADERETAEIYESLYTPLVMHSVNINTVTQLNDYQADLSRIQIFIYCDIPDELKMKTDVQGLQQGRALFVIDLALPEKKIDPQNE